MLAVIVCPGETFGADVEKLTTPVTELYTPTPRTALVTVTLPVGNPGFSLSVRMTLVAVALGAVLKLAKLTKPITVLPGDASDGKPAKLTLISDEL